jgi:type VI secretion system protein VasD
MSMQGTHRSSYGRQAADGEPGATTTRRMLLLGGAATGALVLSGCSTPPPKPIVTPIAMTLVAGADVNPDVRARPSPLTVRIYALKTSGAFDSADFFTLFEKDQATLGAEMIQREEMLLRPGDNKKLEMTLPADGKALGVIAAYRDLERARWREVRVVEPGKPLVLTINFGARQIRIDPPK